MTWKDEELRYSATARCACGAGLAYAPKDPGDPSLPFKGPSSWDCSDILTGRAIPKGEPGWVTHSDKYPFIFYEIKDETQPSARGATTRPA